MRILGLIALLWGPMSLTAQAEVRTLDTGVQVLESSGHSYYTGLKHKPDTFKGLGETHFTLNDCDNLPDEFDLRDLGVVGNVKDQGQCGSCWAFSLTASLESAKAAETGNQSVLDLSEQQLVSCDHANYGCGGGMLNDFDYQIRNGQTTEAAYPYRASDTSCRTGMTPAAKGVSFANVGQSGRRATTQEVQCALFQSHTIPWITVSANDGWGNIPSASDGLHTSCYNGQTNHAVGVVGWKKVNGQVYFKMRNSWGTSWGSDAGRPGMEKGYAMMKLGCDNLGEEVAFVTTHAMACQPPAVKLPAEVSLGRGEETRLAVRAENGVDYSWYLAGAKVGEGDSLFVTPLEDAIYKVVAKNGCGTSESSLRVRALRFD